MQGVPYFHFKFNKLKDTFLNVFWYRFTEYSKIVVIIKYLHAMPQRFRTVMSISLRMSGFGELVYTLRSVYPETQELRL